VYLHCLVHKLLHGQLYTHLYVGYIVFYFIFCIVIISGSRCKSWLYYNMELRWFFCTYGPSQVINQMLMIELKFWIQLFMSTAVHVLKMLGSSTGSDFSDTNWCVLLHQSLDRCNGEIKDLALELDGFGPAGCILLFDPHKICCLQVNTR
jgi:hypothetical protein